MIRLVRIKPLTANVPLKGYLQILQIQTGRRRARQIRVHTACIKT